MNKKIGLLLVAMVMVLSLVVVGCAPKAGPSESTSPAAEGPSYQWRISTQASDAKRITPQFGYRFIENVRKASNGRITIGLYLGGIIGDWTTSSEMVKEGSLEMSLNCQYPGVDDRLNVQFLNNLCSSTEDARTVIMEPNGWLNEIQRPIWQDIGWHQLAAINPGWVGLNMKTSDAPPTTVDGWFEYAGKTKIRCEPSKVMEKAGEALGFKVTVMNFSEVYTALQTGVIDGWLGSPLESGINYSDVINSHINSRNRIDIQSLFMNLDLWESLSKEDQDLLTNAAIEAQNWSWDDYDQREQPILEEAAAAGIAVYDLKPEIMAEIRKRDQENGWVFAEGLVGTEIMDQVRAHIG